MDITFEEYTEQVTEGLSYVYGKDYKVSSSKYNKVGGVTLTGISIIKNDDSNRIAPVTYIDGMYEKGLSVQEAVRQICDIHEEHSKDIDNFQETIDNIRDFDRIKDKISMKIINKDLNKDYLNNVPSVDLFDMSCIFVIIVGQNKSNGSVGTITIGNALLETWGKTVDDLYKCAMENDDDYESTDMADMLRKIMPDNDIPEDTNIPMYVLSNKSRMNGATVLMHKDVFNSLANKINDDLYILPSSIHEVIVIPHSSANPIELNDMVKEVNDTQITDSEKLSYNVLIYNRESDEIKVA